MRCASGANTGHARRARHSGRHVAKQVQSRAHAPQVPAEAAPCTALKPRHHAGAPQLCNRRPHDVLRAPPLARRRPDDADNADTLRRQHARAVAAASSHAARRSSCAAPQHGGPAAGPRTYRVPSEPRHGRLPSSAGLCATEGVGAAGAATSQHRAEGILARPVAPQPAADSRSSRAAGASGPAHRSVQQRQPDAARRQLVRPIRQRAQQHLGGRVTPGPQLRAARLASQRPVSNTVHAREQRVDDVAATAQGHARARMHFDVRGQRE